MSSLESNYNFQVKVVCDQNKAYPEFTTTFDGSKNTEFKIASKFSCGEINTSAQNLDNNKSISSLVFIFIGLFILSFAGIGFNKFMITIACLLFFVLSIFFIFTFFEFSLNGYASSAIIGAIAACTIFIRYIVNKIKEIFNAMATLLSVKIGYTYGGIVFPNSALHERVF